MKHTIWKYFTNREKEEIWLNNMSMTGLALTGFFLFRYTFNDSDPGEYIYRVELLDKPPRGLEGQKYIKFMEENGAEHISSRSGWVYFRKRADEGQFIMHTTIDSKLAQCRSISTFWLFAACALILNGFGPIGCLVYLKEGSVFNLIFCIICLAAATIAFVHWNPLRKKIKVLKQERILRE